MDFVADTSIRSHPIEPVDNEVNNSGEEWDNLRRQATRRDREVVDVQLDSDGGRPPQLQLSHCGVQEDPELRCREARAGCDAV